MNFHLHPLQVAHLLVLVVLHLQVAHLLVLVVLHLQVAHLQALVVQDDQSDNVSDDEVSHVGDLISLHELLCLIVSIQKTMDLERCVN